MSHPPRLTDRLNLLFEADFRAMVADRRRRHLPTMSATSLFAICAALVNHSDGDGRCWPSQARIAAHASASARTAQLALSILEDERVVEVERRHRSRGAARGDEQTSRYRIRWERLAELDRKLRARANLAHGRGFEPYANLAPDHARDSQRPRASLAPDHARDSRPNLQEEPPKEPSPPTPQRTDGGGDSLADGSSEPDPIATDEQVAAILAAYPGPAGPGTHPDAVWAQDATAVREALRGDGAKLDPPLSAPELLAATQRFATAMRGGSTLRPRVWFRDRGWWGQVVSGRMRPKSETAASTESLLESSRRADLETQQSIAEVDAALSHLSLAQLYELKAHVVAHTSGGRFMATFDPATSALLRGAMRDALFAPETAERFRGHSHAHSA